MKVDGRNVKSFLRAPPANLRAVLFYGPDRGVVRERADAIARHVLPDLADPFRLADLPGDRIQRDPALLADEAGAIAFGGGRRVVRVRDATDGMAEALANALASPACEAMIVIEADELGPRSSLRKLCEDAANAAANGCYHDSERDLADIIGESLKEHGLTADPAACAYLAATLGGDRIATRSEIAKLAAYVGEPRAVTLADVEAVVGDGAAVGMDHVVQAAASGDDRTLERALNRALAEGMEPIALLRVTQRHLERLQLILAQRDAGRAIADILRGFRPPLHFKTADALRAQAQHWTALRAGHALARLIEAELALKTTGNPAPLLLRHALAALAQQARAKAG